MTDSMIPYSFIPGTKAKASEVNANFIALADAIQQNASSAEDNIDRIDAELATKTPKAPFTISDNDANLNDYTEKGTYIFENIPTTNLPGTLNGMMLVVGDGSDNVKQIWFDDGENKQIYTRSYSENTWTNWTPITGVVNLGKTGYYRFPSGFLLQWGAQINTTAITYPIAFSGQVSTVVEKHGSEGGDTTSDSGLILQALTKFEYRTFGVNYFINWISVGF